jgi:hypothetical protein
VGPADVLEEEIPFPLELSDVDTLDVEFVEPCITGCGCIVGKDLLPFESLLGLPLPLDHEMCFPLPLKPDFSAICGFPLEDLPLALPLPLPLDLPLSELVGVLEELSFIRYVHALCVGCMRRRFAEAGDWTVLKL